MKKLLAAVGSLALMAGLAVAVVPAGANVAQGSDDVESLEVIRVFSSVLNYSATGWGGWSCPGDHQYVVGGGVTTTLAGTDIVPPDPPMTHSLAWYPGASVAGVDYPATPFSYTYTPPETGWIAQNAGAGRSLRIFVDCSDSEGDVPSPTLRVMKTYPEGRFAPAGTVFTIKVECDTSQADVDGQTIDPTTLTFVADGTDNPAEPETATSGDGWVKDGTYWTFTSKWIGYKDCTAEETEASSEGGLAALTVLNKCDFTSTLIETTAPVEAAALNGDGSPGCVNPANGATAAGPTPPGQVRFTSPWDRDWEGDKTCDVGPPELTEPAVAAQEGSGLCHQVGTLTVINDKPGDPGWTDVLSASITVTPTFTG